MKGKFGVSMGGMEYAPKLEKRMCNCKKCAEYLNTNILCRLGRDTTKTKYCKWYNGPEIKEKQERNLTCGYLSKMLKSRIIPDRLLHISLTESKSAQFGPYTLRINIERKSQRHKITIIKYKIFLMSGYCLELDSFAKNKKSASINELQKGSLYDRSKTVAEEGRRRIKSDISSQTNPKRVFSQKGQSFKKASKEEKEIRQQRLETIDNPNWIILKSEIKNIPNYKTISRQDREDYF